jgi:outer membrane protein TolC
MENFMRRRIIYIGILWAVSLHANLLLADENLTWESCLIQASQNHPDLISAKQELRQSIDTKAIAASGLFPQATASLSVTQNKSKPSSSMVLGGNSTTTGGTANQGNGTTYAYGLSGSQLLFDGFKTINNVKASSENVKAFQENFNYVSSEVRLRLRTAFINLLKAQELIELTKNIYEIRKQDLDLITLRYNSGTEHKGALMTAQANLAQAESEIHQAMRGVKVSQRYLIKEIGGQDTGLIQAQGDFDIKKQYSQDPDFEEIVKSNHQLLKLVAQKNMFSFDVKADRGGFWPSVSLVGGADKSNETWPPRTTSTDVGIDLSWPLLEGGSKLAQIDQDKSKYLDLQAQQQSLKDSLVVTLEEDWASLQDAIEQVGVQKKFLEADEERYKIAKQQYSVGIITFDNWTIIEDDLVTAKKTFLDDQANALLAEANWVAAQGGTLEYES